jgi:hypothetical protein
LIKIIKRGEAMKNTILALSIAVTVSSVSASEDLAYPQAALTTGDEVVEQVYFVNHFKSFKNYGIGKKGKSITNFILRPKGATPLTMTLERYMTNEPKAKGVNAQDFAVFRSGKLKNMGMLITDYKDQSKTQQFEIFIPSIRKIRRFAQPAKDDAWGGADFTFGDVGLRKPVDETHELLATEKFSGCLAILDLPKNQRTKTSRKLDLKADCSSDGKDVYVLKSTQKDTSWWYDYRISYVDTTRFIDYRTTYFKDGKQVKIIDRSWHSANLDDPRANYWSYWYGTTLTTGHESFAYVPKEATQVNKKYKKNIWSTKTLKKIPKKFKFK